MRVSLLARAWRERGEGMFVRRVGGRGENVCVYMWVLCVHIIDGRAAGQYYY